VGVDGLGVEIAKNALLAGVHNVALCDDQAVSKKDISTNVCPHPFISQIFSNHFSVPNIKII
jgi:hypothetical protein